MQKAWKMALEARDLDGLSALFSAATAFYGSTPAFHATREGLRTHFEILSANLVRSAFEVPHVVRLGTDALAASGDVMVHTLDDGKLTERPFRMPPVLVREDGHCTIATHHASPRGGRPGAS